MWEIRKKFVRKNKLCLVLENLPRATMTRRDDTSRGSLNQVRK